MDAVLLYVILPSEFLYSHPVYAIETRYLTDKKNHTVVAISLCNFSPNARDVINKALLIE